VPRLPESEIEAIKARVSLAELCRQRGLDLAPHGSKDLKARCPFHDDREASFIVTPEKNLFHCLGCGAGGSVIDFVMKMDGLSFRHAVEVLRVNPSVLTGTEPIRHGTARKLAAPVTLDADDHELMLQALAFYQETLRGDARAQAYLRERGLVHPDLVKTFRLGYANRTLGLRLPVRNRKTGEELRTRLQKLGLLRESGHEHFNGCIVFPVLNDAGQVTEIYGRRIARGEGPKHLYLSGPHRGVWNAANLRPGQDWILCESIIDALSFWAHGIAHVTASYGVHGFTPDHWTLLRALKPARVLIAYDNDAAGNSAANELTHQIEAEQVQAWRIELPPNLDANDVARESEDPQSALASLVARAVRMLPDGEPKTEPAPAVAEPSAPTAPVGSLVVSDDGTQAELVRGARAWRVRGLEKNKNFDQLKLNVRLQVRDRFHLDSFDLYNARQRAAFVAAAHQVTGIEAKIVEEDLALILAQVEAHQEKQAATPRERLPAQPVLSPGDEQKALALLRDPRLFDRILADFAKAGTVGEELNKLVGYLVAASRKLDDPLSAIVISRSAAGKSALLNAILAFVPDEDKEVMTAVTAQALFYLPSDGLKHKVLAVVEDEGGQQATYPLKILQSEKQLVLAVTVRDPEGGLPETKLKKVDGPVAQLMTSTQAELDYELANRYLVLTVDEDREQTRRIHAAQREAETLAGLLRKLEREDVLKTHHNAQRLLRPLRVVNPFAQLLTFPDDRLRLRRDHQKYLGLIRTVAFLRQYQKPVKSCDYRGQTVQYIEVDEDDLRLAHPLAAHILGRCLDELAPPTRAFLMELHKLVARIEQEKSVKREHVRLTRREIRETVGWSEAQVRRHLDRLVELEYAVCHRVPGTGARFTYELLYEGEGQDGKPFVPGLVEPEAFVRRAEGDHSSSKTGLSSPVRHGFVAGSSPVRHARASSLSSLAAVS
jgi:DNA primase catalytic core